MNPLELKKLLFILLLAPALIYGQAARKYSNEFLNIGVDAAAFGMGKAVVATTSDVNSGYWNPAGLTNVSDYQGALMHAEYFAGIAKYDYGAFAMPIDSISSFGFSIIRFAVDDILDTTELIDNEGNIDYDRINLFSAADYAFNFSYARKLKIQGLNIGGNAKIVRRTIGDFASSWGFGIDAALQYKSEKWQYGVMLRDITTTFNAWSFDEDELEKIQNAIPGENQEAPETLELTLPKMQLGVARNFDLKKKFSLLAEVDIDARFAETNDLVSTSFISFSPSAGVEANYAQIVYLRAGVNNFQKEVDFNNDDSITLQPNFGVGFKYHGIQIDYALSNIGSVGNALYSNIFSLKVDFSAFR